MHVWGNRGMRLGACASQTPSLRRRKAPGEERLNEAISMSGLGFLPRTHAEGTSAVVCKSSLLSWQKLSELAQTCEDIHFFRNRNTVRSQCHAILSFLISS